MTSGGVIRVVIGIPFTLAVIAYAVNALIITFDGNSIDWILNAAYVGLLFWLSYWLLKPLINKLRGWGRAH